LTGVGWIVNLVVEVDVDGTVIRAEYLVVDISAFDPWSKAFGTKHVVDPRAVI
jgi:hypothetical protein